eukprot:7417271-Lingulodinium_polyedra.AAC.1
MANSAWKGPRRTVRLRRRESALGGHATPQCVYGLVWRAEENANRQKRLAREKTPACPGWAAQRHA